MGKKVRFALLRRPGETVSALLLRLDAALGQVLSSGTVIDEVLPQSSVADPVDQLTGPVNGPPQLGYRDPSRAGVRETLEPMGTTRELVQAIGCDLHQYSRKWHYLYRAVASTARRRISCFDRMEVSLPLKRFPASVGYELVAMAAQGHARRPYTEPSSAVAVAT